MRGDESVQITFLLKKLNGKEMFTIILQFLVLTHKYAIYEIVRISDGGEMSLYKVLK